MRSCPHLSQLKNLDHINKLERGGFNILRTRGEALNSPKYFPRPLSLYPWGLIVLLMQERKAYFRGLPAYERPVIVYIHLLLCFSKNCHGFRI